MMRAVAKAAMLFAFGRAPGGARLYRYLTRQRLGTQSTHVDKLGRVWPAYARVLQERCGVDWAGKDLWIHEGGWTVFPVVVGYLLTGKGAWVTNGEAQLSDRYNHHSLEFAPRLGFDVGGLADRKADLEMLDHGSWEDIVRRLEGRVMQGVEPSAIPMLSDSADVCHSGGTLEHYRPDDLRAFLKECYRVLRVGGIASHVFDHRDHLHHADRRLPFLNHLRYGDRLYGALFGHPLTYHNRLAPLEVVALFEEAGFELIAVRRMVLPSRKYVDDAEEVRNSAEGLPRPLLAREFQRISEEDLRTAAAHYLFRKRVGA